MERLGLTAPTSTSGTIKEHDSITIKLGQVRRGLQVTEYYNATEGNLQALVYFGLEIRSSHARVHIWSTL
jgi:hypothetical protein